MRFDGRRARDGSKYCSMLPIALSARAACSPWRRELSVTRPAAVESSCARVETCRAESPTRRTRRATTIILLKIAEAWPISSFSAHRQSPRQVALAAGDVPQAVGSAVRAAW